MQVKFLAGAGSERFISHKLKVVSMNIRDHLRRTLMTCQRLPLSVFKFSHVRVVQYFIDKLKMVFFSSFGHPFSCNSAARFISLPR